MTKATLTIVTATAGQPRAQECLNSWYQRGTVNVNQVVVRQTDPGEDIHAPMKHAATGIALSVPDYLGPVPAFRLGVELALQITDPDGIIACLHDDLLIEEDGWDERVLEHFQQHPQCGLVGFGGGKGLGADDIYQTPYNPMQLARQDFVSNMRDAEAHGRRVTEPTQVACLDGFSQIGRVEFWQGAYWGNFQDEARVLLGGSCGPLTALEQAGIRHHAYDSFLGADAIRRGWQVWMLPIACTHYGGQTAVGDSGYQQWANAQRPKLAGDLANVIPHGDQYFWVEAHQTVYNLLRGVLPIRVK